MTRDELLTEAQDRIAEAKSCADTSNEIWHPLAGPHALIAIACILLAREIGEGEVVRQAEREAEQAVAEQAQDELAAAKARIAELEGAIRRHKDALDEHELTYTPADQELYKTLNER